jgi:hypothetical protein
MRGFILFSVVWPVFSSSVEDILVDTQSWLYHEVLHPQHDARGLIRNKWLYCPLGSGLHLEITSGDFTDASGDYAVQEPASYTPICDLDASTDNTAECPAG